ncbi:hypothetical protein AMTRI_Chr04g242690 [Amborella trichopoda]
MARSLVGLYWMVLVTLCNLKVGNGTVEYGVGNEGHMDSKGRTVINVKSYGAVGDGITDDTKAFLDAWEAACSIESAILQVPRTKTLVVKPSTFKGPCQINITLLVDGTLVAPSNLEDWGSDRYWLKFTNLNHFKLRGKGTLKAQGKQWWNKSCSYVNSKRICGNAPNAIAFQHSEYVQVRDLKIMDSPRFHLHFQTCNHVYAIKIQITSPQTSPNTDGIHLERTQNAHILNSTIAAGDDCVSIGHGSYNVTISGLTCGPGHGIRFVAIVSSLS